MKNLKYALHSAAALAVVSLAAACSNEDGLEGSPSGVKETVTLMAWQPGSEGETRVGFDRNGNAYWQGEDAIGVWSNGDAKFVSFGIATGAGTAKASFSGEVTGGVGKYAVYPYNEKHSIQDDVLTYNRPVEYTYTSVDKTFLLTDNSGNSFNMPMYGTVADGKVSFKNLGGVICLKIDKMPAGSGTVTVTATGKQLCGTFTASLAATTPEITTTASDADNTVSFEYSGATADSPGVFYLPAATGDYTLTVVVSDDKKTSTTIHSVKMVREGLKVVKVTTEYILVSKTIDGHNFVDLGLSSGILWAETNIGATTAYDDGNYYAWGETVSKSSYSWNSYKYGTSSSSLTKYTSSDKTTLEASDDAATVNWGSGCRMPTKEELEELKNNCAWTCVSMTNSAGETIGCYKVASNNNGNFIYLPASGYRDGGSLGRHGLSGLYWSSTLRTGGISYAYYLSFNSGDHGVGYGDRYSGQSVRPVAEP